MKSLFIRLILPVAALLVFMSSPESSAGQSLVGNWSPPQRIAGASAKAHHHFGLIPDRTGIVHLLWTQEDVRGSTISYSRWDGSSWSTPVDVLLAPIANAPEYLGGAIDDQGILHVIFFNSSNQQDGRIFYTRARASEAGSAHSWQPPLEVAPRAVSAGNVAVDGNGLLHVLYGQYGEGLVNSVSSADGGRTWSSPVEVSGDCVRGTIVQGIAMVTDGAGRVHATWSVHNELARGEIACYARLMPGQASWSAAGIVDMLIPGGYSVAYSNVEAVGNDEIHLIWQGAAAPPVRLHRWSEDGGMTWNPPNRMTDLVGENGMAGPMAVDSAGNLHAITHGRYMNPEEIHGVFYVPWEGDKWGAMLPIAQGKKEDLFDPQEPRLVSYNGNQLLAVYGNDPPRGLWFSFAQTNAPPLPPQSYPTEVASRASIPIPTPTPKPTAAADPTSTPVPANIGPGSAPPPLTAPPTLLLAVLPAALLSGLVVLVRFRERLSR